MSSRIYVGNLPMDMERRDVEDLFYKYGRIKDISVKNPPRPPSFAFVEFDDPRDAEDAVHGRNGYEYEGARLRVEMSKNRPSGRGADRGGADRDRFGDRERDRRDRRGSFDYRDDRRGAPRRSEFKLYVSGLPSRCSWQDLKDFMRSVGDVLFTKAEDGEGVVEFKDEADVNRALDTLDNKLFDNKFGDEECRIKLSKHAPGRKDRSRSRSPKGRSRSRSSRRSRSRSRSSRRSRSRSKARSVSPAGKPERSVSRSPRKSPMKTAEPPVAAPASPAKSPLPVKMAQQEPSEMEVEETATAPTTTMETDPAAATPVAATEAAPAPAADGAVDYSSWKVVELREELKKRDLDTKGNKPVLVERLQQQ